MTQLSNNNTPFLDNLITPNVPVDFELNLHKKGIENRHKVEINLWEPV